MTQQLTLALCFPWYFNMLVRIVGFCMWLGLMTPRTAALALSKTITVKTEQTVAAA